MALSSLLSLSAFAAVAAAQALNLNVASSGGNASSPLHYGIMFEDLNFCGDGGLYAELIRNRALQGSSEHPSTLTGWSSVGGTSLSLQNLSQPVSSALPTSLQVSTEGTTGRVGFANTGWWGIEVKQQDYKGSFWVSGSYNGTFTASLVSDLDNTTYGTVDVESSDSTASSNGWLQYNYTLTPSYDAPVSNNSFVLTFDAAGASDGSLNFNIISLFPPTYNNRPNGNRIDLMQALADLNPSFLRLPGGNNLEGDSPPYLWYWNQTLGPLTDRPGRPGTWGYENTDGLGLIEYLEWCQDLNMEPILAVWGGEYLDGTIIDNSTLQTYVQYALDELEFLTGDTSTTYGAMRAQLGYPDPFPINYVEVGNEDNLNGGEASYEAYRFPSFYNALKAAYPNLTVIASTIVPKTLPGDASGDYHQYTRPDQFVMQFSMFDNFTTEHTTLVGEYATVQPNIPQGGGANFSAPRSRFPFWIGTVAEAVFLIGTERNSEKMIGASYAPTFQNLNGYQWAPDLISFSADSSQTVLSTSHHMIELFSGTRISNTLPVSGGSFGPAYYVAGTNDNSHILKTAVYNSTGDVPVSVTFDGVASGTTANLTVLTAPDANSYNELGSDVVQTNVTTITASGNGTFEFSLPDLSVSVLVVDAAPSSGYAKRDVKTIPRGYREIVF